MIKAILINSTPEAARILIKLSDEELRILDEDLPRVRHLLEAYANYETIETKNPKTGEWEIDESPSFIFPNNHRIAKKS